MLEKYFNKINLDKFKIIKTSDCDFGFYMS